MKPLFFFFVNLMSNPLPFGRRTFLWSSYPNKFISEVTNAEDVTPFWYATLFFTFCVLGTCTNRLRTVRDDTSFSISLPIDDLNRLIRHTNIGHCRSLLCLLQKLLNWSGNVFVILSLLSELTYKSSLLNTAMTSSTHIIWFKN